MRRPESARMNFVPPLIGRLPLDDAIRAFELDERAHAGSVGVNEIGVMGDVGDELGAGIAKSGDPLRPRRAHELNDPQALAVEALRSRTSWAGAGARFGIDGTAVQQDEAVLVHGLDRRMGAQLLRGTLRHLIKKIAAIVGDPAAPKAIESACQRAILHAQLPPARASLGLDGGSQCGHELPAKEEKERSDQKEAHGTSARVTGALAVVGRPGWSHLPPLSVSISGFGASSSAAWC